MPDKEPEAVRILKDIVNTFAELRTAPPPISFPPEKEKPKKGVVK